MGILLLIEAQLGIRWQILIKEHQVVDKVKLRLRRLILRVQLQSLRKLVLGPLVLARRAQYQPPHYPALRILRLLLHSFPDLLDSLDHVSLFELCECPVHVRVVIRSVELFGLPTDVQCLLVDHVDVE